MCGVIGVWGDNLDEILYYTMRLFQESQVRGKHATGLSYIKNDEIKTEIKPISSKQFVEEFDWSVLPEKIKLIGHTRYSTSDLKYNQPIFNESISIVHNGVITQQDPSLWKQHYGYDCKTRNDSELILRSTLVHNIPLEEFNQSSMAVLELTSNHIMFYRNGNRPLWWVVLNDCFYVASTKDILLRTFSEEQGLLFNKCESNSVYMIDNSGFDNFHVTNNHKDFQIESVCGKYYNKVVL
jgi:glutamine phosphoribosylpyrophosphate amidotransferase